MTFCCLDIRESILSLTWDTPLFGPNGNTQFCTEMK
jgi:hypothetical protein